MALIPYSNNMEPLKESELTDEFMIYAWPYRAELWSRINFNGKTYRNAGRSWWEWHQLPRDASAHKWSIAFTDLATHNHFSLERDRVAFNRHAPIIKLKSDVADEIHLGLLGVLNSSTACFWLKQVSQNRGSTVDGQGARQITIPWENFYDFTGANIQELPLAPNLPVEAGAQLDRLARQLSAVEPIAVCADGVPTRERLAAARAEYDRIRDRMVALQEELDWDVYLRYGLLDDADGARMIADPACVPEVKLGERAFEIVLARQRAAGKVKTQWFERHRSTPSTEVPVHWPEAYKAVVASGSRRSRSGGILRGLSGPSANGGGSQSRGTYRYVPRSRPGFWIGARTEACGSWSMSGDVSNRG